MKVPGDITGYQLTVPKERIKLGDWIWLRGRTLSGAVWLLRRAFWEVVLEETYEQEGD